MRGRKGKGQTATLLTVEYNKSRPSARTECARRWAEAGGRRAAVGGGEVAVSRRQRQVLHRGRHLCLPPPSRGIRQFSTREIKLLRQMSADSGLLRKKMIAATGLAGVISNVLFFACSESLFVLICRYVKNCHRRAPFDSARKSSSSEPEPCAGTKAKGKPRLYSQ